MNLKLLSKSKTLVFGDVMLDRYVSGAVERVSPEAPVPVLKPTKEVAQTMELEYFTAWERNQCDKMAQRNLLRFFSQKLIFISNAGNSVFTI